MRRIYHPYNVDLTTCITEPAFSLDYRVEVRDGNVWFLGLIKLIFIKGSFYCLVVYDSLRARFWLVWRGWLRGCLRSLVPFNSFKKLLWSDFNSRLRSKRFFEWNRVVRYVQKWFLDVISCSCRRSILWKNFKNFDNDVFVLVHDFICLFAHFAFFNFLQL